MSAPAALRFGDIRFVPFRPEHLAALDVCADIAAASPALADPRFGEAVAAAGGIALSAVADFRTVAIGGVTEMWAGVYRGWLAPSRHLRRRHWPAITEMARLALAEAAGARRIETVVREDFAAGHRWARALGFASEGLMRRWGPDGLDYRMYSIVSDEASGRRPTPAASPVAAEPPERDDMEGM